ncbi:MAG: hypothetical protein Q9174_002141 [Haloplaca sp. 1 TL-2023]
MTLRLGLLQDHAAVDRQIAREAAEALAKKQKQDIPTVKTEAQTKADESAVAKEKDRVSGKVKAASKPKIRPLSETKAIDAGANFASETFLLGVGVGLLFFERWWSSRKESNRREDVADRIAELEESERSARKGLVELEKELLRLRAKDGKDKSPKRILPREVWDPEEREEEEPDSRWRGILSYFRRSAVVKEQGPPPKAELQPVSEISEHSTSEDVTTAKPTTSTTVVWPFAPSSEKAKLLTHDLALPVEVNSIPADAFQQNSKGHQQLYLILTSFSLSENQRSDTVSRIERFATITTSPKPAILFLLNHSTTPTSSAGGLQAFMTLQTLLHEISVSLDLLPVASPAQLSSLLKVHMTPSPQIPAIPASRQLLQRVTASAPNHPLSEHATNVLSDICRSIGDVAKMAGDAQGMTVLEDFLGREDAKNIESFWAEEWMCD